MLESHVHKVFHCSVRIVECCSHCSFHIGPIKAHIHQFLNCAFSGSTDTECIGVVESRWSDGRRNRLRSRWWRCRSNRRECDRHRNGTGLRSRRSGWNRWCGGSRRRRRWFHRCRDWFRLETLIQTENE